MLCLQRVIPRRRSLQKAMKILAVFIGGALLVFSGMNLVNLPVDTEVINALLLPVVLGFLVVLDAKMLPQGWRMQGYKWTVWGLSGIIMLFGVYMGISLVV